MIARMHPIYLNTEAPMVDRATFIRVSLFPLLICKSQQYRYYLKSEKHSKINSKKPA